MQKKSPKCYQKYHLKVLKNIALLMINALIFFSLLMILHYSLPILSINANAISLIFFINANTLIPSMQYLKSISRQQDKRKLSAYRSKYIYSLQVCR